MPSRRVYIEQIRRLIYGGQPSDDATITVNLVNLWLDQGIAIAARKNYTDNYTMDGVSYMNGSFYTTFKNLAVVGDELFLWKITLPQLPLGIGDNEGIATLTFKWGQRRISQPTIWLNQNQRSYFQNMRPIPNKLLAYPEGEFIYVITPLPLFNYTAIVTMVSGGLSSDLDSTINVPNDYIPVITDYLKTQLMFERSVKVDTTEDGQDVISNV